MARAFDWQSKGHRFDSDILHQRGSSEPLFLFQHTRKFSVYREPFKNLQIRQALPDKSRIQQIPSVESVSPIPLYSQIAWTHYERLIRVANEEARIWYLRETASENWSYRTLDNNSNTQYYNCLLLSLQKEVVRQDWGVSASISCEHGRATSIAAVSHGR